ELEKEIARLKSQISQQRYGLVWLDVPEGFEGDSENRIPILEEVPEKEIHNSDGKPCHILIEGDNYHALTCLNYTHRGRVDVIYIDPPYNTGSDGFTYRDRRFLTEKPDGTPVPKDHPLRHSYWLSFMSKRLELAKNLLSDRGVIFISIDDNEQANLKLMCDRIFGEENFVGNIDWESKTKSQNTVSAFNKLQPKVEHIFLYSKNGRRRFNVNTIGQKVYDQQDERGIYRYQRVELMNAKGVRGRESMIFPILGIVPPQGRQWKLGLETITEYQERGDIFLLDGVPTLKIRPEDERTEISEPFWGFLSKEIGTAESAKKYLTSIMYPIAHGFETVKPVELVQRLIFHGCVNKSSTILDFFAGSGTTLHATMKLNEEDGGNRQCILVQLDENGICENVTYERNRRVMQGYTNSKGEAVPGLGNSLKYYRTAFVGKNPPLRALDSDRLELACKAGNLLALAENTLFEIERTEAFQIFTDAADPQNVTAIYFLEDIDRLEEFQARVEALAEQAGKVAVYIFSWDDGAIYDSMFDACRNVEVKSIPQPILEIYQTLQ
ncbi:MAG: site-specific DNA-methyltransferase, partial [Thermoguttaceae bacterium]|nr:site-specific DNA-methyltransferase [Thermoguttaceae bacterium]